MKIKVKRSQRVSNWKSKAVKNEFSEILNKFDKLTQQNVNIEEFWTFFEETSFTLFRSTLVVWFVEEELFLKSFWMWIIHVQLHQTIIIHSIIINCDWKNFQFCRDQISKSERAIWAKFIIIIEWPFCLISLPLFLQKITDSNFWSKVKLWLMSWHPSSENLTNWTWKKWNSVAGCKSSYLCFAHEKMTMIFKREYN